MKEYKLTFTLELPSELDEDATSAKFKEVMDLVEAAVGEDRDYDSERLARRASDELLELINELRS